MITGSCGSARKIVSKDELIRALTKVLETPQEHFSKTELAELLRPVLFADLEKKDFMDGAEAANKLTELIKKYRLK